MCELRCLHIHGPELITGGQHVCPLRADHVRRTFQHLYSQLINVAASQVCTCPHTYVYIDAHRLFGIVRDPWLPGTANSRATALWENVVPDTSGQLDQALRICQPEMHQSMIPWPLDPLGVCFLPQWAIQQMWGGRVADPHADVSTQGPTSYQGLRTSCAQDFTIACVTGCCRYVVCSDGLGGLRGVMDCLARFVCSAAVSGRTSFDVPP